MKEIPTIKDCTNQDVLFDDNFNLFILKGFHSIKQQLITIINDSKSEFKSLIDRVVIVI